MITGEVETKDDVYKELENQYNDEQRRTIQAARAANVQGAVLPGDTKDNEQRGSGAPADVGEQAEAFVNRNKKCSDFGKKNYSGNGNSLCSNFGNNSAVTVVLN